MDKRKIYEILPMLPQGISKKLYSLPGDVLEEICEIRLRKNSPLALTFKEKTLFLCKNAMLCEKISGGEIIISNELLNACWLSLCKHSVFAHENEIKEGYISLPGGSRAGVAGSFCDGILTEINSLNIRIAHEVTGCAKALKNAFCGGLLIAGPPASGKTTLLRDLCRILSSGETGTYYRVAVIDSRKEIAPEGTLGTAADVISMEDRAKGAEIALRTLSPQIIAFDEIGSEKELRSAEDCLNAGVTVITTAHAGSVSELTARRVIKNLLLSGAIKNVALCKNIGEEPMTFMVGELIGGMEA